MEAGQALAAGVPARGDCKQQLMGLWLTQWSTDGLHPVQPLPTLNSNTLSVPQLPPDINPIFPERIFSWSQTSAAA